MFIIYANMREFAHGLCEFLFISSFSFSDALSSYVLADELYTVECGKGKVYFMLLIVKER
jgi:hypothetical protein